MGAAPASWERRPCFGAWQGPSCSFMFCLARQEAAVGGGVGFSRRPAVGARQRQPTRHANGICPTMPATASPTHQRLQIYSNNDSEVSTPTTATLPHRRPHITHMVANRPGHNTDGGKRTSTTAAAAPRQPQPTSPTTANAPSDAPKVDDSNQHSPRHVPSTSAVPYRAIVAVSEEGSRACGKVARGNAQVCGSSCSCARRARCVSSRAQVALAGSHLAPGCKSVVV